MQGCINIISTHGRLILRVYRSRGGHGTKNSLKGARSERGGTHERIFFPIEFGIIRLLIIKKLTRENEVRMIPDFLCDKEGTIGLVICSEARRGFHQNIFSRWILFSNDVNYARDSIRSIK